MTSRILERRIGTFSRVEVVVGGPWRAAADGAPGSGRIPLRKNSALAGASRLMKPQHQRRHDAAESQLPPSSPPPIPPNVSAEHRASRDSDYSIAFASP